MNDDFWGTRIESVQEAADFILRAYQLMGAADTPVTVHDLVMGITRLANAENVVNPPLEGRRERATTQLKQQGLIVRSGRGWMLTPTGQAHLTEMENQVQDLEDFMAGNH